MNVSFTKWIAAACLPVLFGAGQLYAQNQNTDSTASRPVPVVVPVDQSARFQHHRSTEFGDALDAYSNVIDATGRAELNRSAAITNLQYAEQLRLQNLITREQAKIEIERRKLELQSLQYQRVSLVKEQAKLAQAQKKPTPAVNKQGYVFWNKPLREEAFADHRTRIESQITALKMSSTLNDREQMLDTINDSCQNLIAAIDEETSLKPDAQAAGRRFVVRLYDELQQPLGEGTHLTSLR